MKKYAVLFVFLSIGLITIAQKQSQLDYCRSEVANLEKEIGKYKTLLEIQNKNLLELKLRIVDLNRDIKVLNHEKNELNTVSEDLMELALKYESRGNYREAMDIYRMLIKKFPKSLDAAASKIKVVDLQKQKPSKNHK